MDPFIILAAGMLVVVGCILYFKFHAFLALVLGAVTVSLLTSEFHIQKYADSKELSKEATKDLLEKSTGKKVAEGFGGTAGKIGILIVMAALIGKCLLDSGAAEKIVRSLLKVFGEKRAPTAFMGSGFLLGVPVYFDTVFYLMIPLAKSAAIKAGKNFALYVMAIIAGATMAHSLVPPTPGPLLVASELDVDIGKMILGGILLGGLTLIPGYLYASWINSRYPIPLRDSSELSVDTLVETSAKENRELPPLWLSLLPVLLPVVLISGSTVIKSLDLNLDAYPNLNSAVVFLGNKEIALTVSAMIALSMLYYHSPEKGNLKASIQKAVIGAGEIILITSAGGAFGAMLQQTGIGPHIQDLASQFQVGVLPLAFFVTALIRTAQGSATVAMITSVGIFSGMVDDLGIDPLYLALAIGCGSKPFPWMNDSGFWVIGKMSGMTEKETLRTSSTMMSLMALFGLIILMVVAGLVPDI